MGRALERLLDQPALETAFLAGVAGLVAGAALAGVWYLARGRRAVPVAGLLFALGSAAALHLEAELPSRTASGLVILAAAGLLAPVVRTPRLGPGATGLLLAVPGAWLLVAPGDLAAGEWADALLITAVAGGGTLVADLDHRYRDLAIGPALLAITAGGIYLTVPDTERATILLAVALPLALLGWPWRLASLGRAGAYAAVGTVVWIAAVEGRGRPGSVVGAVACLGLFLAEPMQRLLFRRSILETAAWVRWGPLPALAAHLVLVLFASRVAGRPAGTAEAAALAGGGLAVAVVLARALPAPGPVEEQRPGEAVRSSLPCTGDG